MKLGFIGAGTVGTALAYCLSNAGYPVVAVASRSRDSAQKLADRVPGCHVYETPQQAADVADMLFVTTPDGVIRQVAEAISWRPGQIAVHCSGADSLEPLDSAHRAGASTAVFHPLQSFADAAYAIENLPSTTFALEGDEVSLEHLKRMAEALNGRWITLQPGDKILYHAAAVVACNYLVSLANISSGLWQSFGISREEALESLLPLMKGTLNNLTTVGLPTALTGPIARGDIGTVRKHLQALEADAPSLLPVYRALGLETVPLALEKGRITVEQSEAMKALLREEGHRNGALSAFATPRRQEESRW